MEKEVLFQARKKDFKLDWFNGTGCGGQFRNKTANCLRMTHIPTGITVVAQGERDRPSNQKAAFKKMVERLLVYWIGEKQKERYPTSTETIRTYNEPDNRVIDHLSGKRLTYKEVVDKGDLSEMIDARRFGIAGTKKTSIT